MQRQWRTLVMAVRLLHWRHELQQATRAAHGGLLGASCALACLVLGLRSVPWAVSLHAALLEGCTAETARE